MSKKKLRVEAATMVFHAGRNRYPIQITTKSGTPVDSVDVAVYVAKPGQRKGPAVPGQGSAMEQPARGPFPARMTTLATRPRFTATSTSDDPRSATVVYVASVEFPTDGEWRVGAIVKDRGETLTTTLPAAFVGEFRKFPRVGRLAPRIHTPTAASVGGNLAAISTRRPPATMNQVDFASVLGRKPILLLFASPKFSWNGTAGPTVDVAEQVRRGFRHEVVFINVEIYNDDDPEDSPRPQVRAYHLPSQPWSFAIDRLGRIVGEAEGAIGVGELTAIAERAAEH